MLRIRQTPFKVLFVIAAIAVLFVANGLLFSRLLPAPFPALASEVVYVLAFVVGTRSFRGAGEPIAPPRAGWRMTARPTAGFVIGSLLLVRVLIVVGGTVAGTPIVASSSAEPAGAVVVAVVGLLVDVVLAVLYFRSSLRLRRSPPATAPEPLRLGKPKPLR